MDLRKNLANQEIAHATIASLREYLDKDEQIITLLESLYLQAVFQLETQAVDLEEGKTVADVIHPFALLQWIGEHLTELPINLNKVLETFLSSSSFQPLLEDPKSYSSTEFVKFLLGFIDDPTQNDSQALMVALESGNQEASTILRKYGCTLLTKLSADVYSGRLPHGISYDVIITPVRGFDALTHFLADYRVNENQQDSIHFMKTNFNISHKYLAPVGTRMVKYGASDDAIELTFVTSF